MATPTACADAQCPCHHIVAELVTLMRRYDLDLPSLRAQVALWRDRGSPRGSYGLFAPFDLVLAMLDAAEVPDARA